MSMPVLTPRLIVSNAAEASAFYQSAFEAKELERYASPDGAILHAALSIRGAVFSIADANPNWYPPMPAEGSPVLLTLACADPDRVAALATKLGGTLVIPIEDRPYGHREGRLRDPFGHFWILTRPL